MGDVRFEDVRDARRVVVALLVKARASHDHDLFASLVEAKRTLGISVSIWWPEYFEDLVDEQG